MPRLPRILVVDDDDNIVHAFRSFLEREHCLMDSASSSEEALLKLSRAAYDLIIADVSVSAGSGMTPYLRIKHEFPELPVIVITGHPDIIDETEVRKVGANNVFLKPLELDKFRTAVRKCLHLSNG